MRKRIEVRLAQQKQVHQLAVVAHERVPARPRRGILRGRELEQRHRAVGADGGGDGHGPGQRVAAKFTIYRAPAERAGAGPAEQQHGRAHRDDPRAELRARGGRDPRRTRAVPGGRAGQPRRRE